MYNRQKQTILDMEQRDKQAKAIAARKNPVRINKVCQAYADPELRCELRERCQFEHPPLCRIPDCFDENCLSLHIEGLDYGKWRREEIVNPFKEPCKHFLQGKCNYERCRFPHIIPVSRSETTSTNSTRSYQQVPPPVEYQESTPIINKTVSVHKEFINKYRLFPIEDSSQENVPPQSIKNLTPIITYPVKSNFLPSLEIDSQKSMKKQVRFLEHIPSEVQSPPQVKHTADQTILSQPAIVPVAQPVEKTESSVRPKQVVRQSEKVPESSVVRQSGIQGSEVEGDARHPSSAPNSIQTNSENVPLSIREARLLNTTGSATSEFSIRDLIKKQVREVIYEEMGKLKDPKNQS